jgi:hypothetical protein
MQTTRGRVTVRVRVRESGSRYADYIRARQDEKTGMGVPWQPIECIPGQASHRMCLLGWLMGWLLDCTVVNRNWCWCVESRGTERVW